jgi:hypothetical protein
MIKVVLPAPLQPASPITRMLRYSVQHCWSQLSRPPVARRGHNSSTSGVPGYKDEGRLSSMLTLKSAKHILKHEEDSKDASRRRAEPASRRAKALDGIPFSATTGFPRGSYTMRSGRRYRVVRIFPKTLPKDYHFFVRLPARSPPALRRGYAAQKVRRPAAFFV